MPTLPNCSITSSVSSSSSASWKFFTLACVTRPLKLRQYACIWSFHFGDLLRRTMMSSLCPFRTASTMPSFPLLSDRKMAR